VKVLVQPDDGVNSILTAINRAKKSVEVVIFRLDRKQIEEAIRSAAARGIFVRALVAFANRGGEQQLRRLETRFLDSGVTVTRTSDDLVRYHAKMMIVDRKTLYVLSYNYTTLDIEHSRAFGLVTRNKALVAEAIKLFEADTARKPYTPQLNNFPGQPVERAKTTGGIHPQGAQGAADLRPEDLRHPDGAAPGRATESGRGDQNHRAAGEESGDIERAAA
jgi:phosphatidylserine/phosphatidylglycerophosphate/cardiolipin synthase-like enzyme